MEDVHAELLVTAIGRVATDSGMAWLNGARDQLQASTDTIDTLSTLSAMARRMIGVQPLAPAAVCVQTGAGHLDLGPWPAGDAGRIVLVLDALRHAPAWAERIVPSLFWLGDEGERVAIIRGLCLFRDPAALKHLALEAGRANSLVLFSALALGNPYPAAHYSEHEFNQLVLKVLFNALPVDGVAGLGARANPELSRMCEDYVGERRAAGRPLPADIWLALAPHASAQGIALLIEHLADPDPLQRYYAARAAAARADEPAELPRRLRERLGRETEPRILNVLRASVPH